jgi:hypothetical protein
MTDHRGLGMTHRPLRLVASPGIERQEDPKEEEKDNCEELDRPTSVRSILGRRLIKMPGLITIERKRMVMVIEMQYFGVGSEGPLPQP